MSQFIEMFGDTPQKEIAEVCEVRGGSTPTRTSKEFWDNGTVSWFTVEDIYKRGRYINETKQHITELATKKCFVYPIDTVLICCTASVGEYAITKKEMASNQQFNGMMIKDKTELHPEYLLYVASTLKEVLLRQAGKTTINFVSRSKLESIEIPVPSYSDQLRFVSIYHQADKSGFDGRKSQFIEMFGNNKQTGKQGVLADYCTLKAGKSVKSGDISENYEEGLYPCYGGNGRRGYVSSYSHDGIYNIIGRQGALCGNVNIVNGKFYATEHAVVVTPKEQIAPHWLYFALSGMNLNQYARGVAQPGLAVNQLEQLPFTIPSMELQKQFVSIAEQADKSGSVLQYRIAC